MLEHTEQLLRDKGSELVFGLVAPVGADLDWLTARLSELLKLFDYTPKVIRLSALLKQIPAIAEDLQDTPESARLDTYMTGGNKLRELAGSGEILALWAVSELYRDRLSSATHVSSKTDRAYRHAYILRSIKHPDEVRALRGVYGPGFFLISVSASRSSRIAYLQRKGLNEEQAAALIDRDAGEPNDFGQQTREAFQLADVFIRQERVYDETTAQLDRFLDLVFGSPHITPTPDEHAMFLAYASSLRSGDLSRQVGAVIWDDAAGVIATGCNDVPAAGGGLQWPGDRDNRDHERGYDSNEIHKRQIADQITTRVLEALSLNSDDARAKIAGAVETTRLLDITEFGRAVHAEMDALLSCARSGVRTRGATLFSTTFPCHNCAKHIVAAGISTVVYIEPYEKSQAIDLHGDAIVVDDHGDQEIGGSQPDGALCREVVFKPFVGIGPRRYFDLFSMRLSDGYQMKRKVKGGNTIAWSRRGAIARVPMLTTSYIEREAELVALMSKFITEEQDGEDQD